MTSDEQPHVLFLCLDTVRKDFYDEYAPRLQSLATHSYEQMRAASSWSVPSHASMFTGDLPHEHGIHGYNRNFASTPVSDTWLSDFDDYQRVCYSANVYAGDAFGFDTWFDETTRITPNRIFPTGIDVDAYVQERDDGDGIPEFFAHALSHDAPLRSFVNGGAVKLNNLLRTLPVRNPFDSGTASIGRAVKTRFAEAEQADEPLFTFANVMEAHGPHEFHRRLSAEFYDGPSTFNSQQFRDWEVTIADGLGDFAEDVELVRDLYRAEIDYADRVLSELIEHLQSTLDRDLVVIITADHGENLGYEADHHYLNHTSSLTEALLHVPFDVITPAGGEETIQSYMTHLDLRTIMQRALDGKPLRNPESPLAAEIAGSGTGTPDDVPDPEYWDQALRAIYDPDSERKYVLAQGGDAMSYDVSGPSCSQTPVDDPVPAAVTDRFDMSVEEFGAAAEQSESDQEMSAAAESRLKELGYMEG